MKLNHQNVENLFKECLSETGILIRGINVSAKLNILGHEEDIMSLLLQLPEEFYLSSGKGSSFYNAYVAKDGEEWTGMQTTTEKLVVLGIAIGKTKFFIPDKKWISLPGEMPYFVIYDENKTGE